MNKTIFNIKKILKPLLKKISNKKIRDFIIFLHNKSNEYTYNRSVLKYYSKFDLDQIEPEKAKVINFLRENPFNLFPYEFTKKYSSSDIKVLKDEKNGLKYSFLNGKKIYFKKTLAAENIKNVLNSLTLEQDTESPHRYLVDNFNVSENDIVADIGAAEGDFALSIVDKVKKIYIFEANPELIEALTATFEPWKEKVVIVNNYVSNKSNDMFTTLDVFFKDKELPTFLKIDIEGAEYDLIQGAKKVLSTNDKMKVIMAAYHKHNDEVVLDNELKKYDFKTEFSKGYMLSIWDGIIKEPFLRRALIRAKK